MYIICNILWMVSERKPLANFTTASTKITTATSNCTVLFHIKNDRVACENSMLKHRNVNLNTVNLKASDCTINGIHKCDK
jgi:hypothetical protein